jgi:hypothetical protein
MDFVSNIVVTIDPTEIGIRSVNQRLYFETATNE